MKMEYLVEGFFKNTFNSLINFFSNKKKITKEQYLFLKKDAYKKVERNKRAYNKLKSIILNPSYQVKNKKNITIDDLSDISIHRFFYTRAEYNDIIYAISEQFSNSRITKMVNNIIQMLEKGSYDLEYFKRFCTLLYSFAKKNKISLFDACRIHGIYKKYMNPSIYKILMKNIEDIFNNNKKNIFKVCDPFLQKVIKANMDRYYKFDIIKKDATDKDNNDDEHNNYYYANNKKEKYEYEYIYNSDKYGPFEPNSGFRTGSIEDVINSFDTNSKDVVNIDSRIDYDDDDEEEIEINESYNIFSLIDNYLN